MFDVAQPAADFGREKGHFQKTEKNKFGGGAPQAQPPEVVPHRDDPPGGRPSGAPPRGGVVPVAHDPPKSYLTEAAWPKAILPEAILPVR